MPRRKRILSPRKEPVQGRSKDLVALLLKATARILIKDGVAGFNTNKLAKVAGISVGSIYQYFPNKEALISSLIEKKLADDKQFFAERMAGFENWSFEKKFGQLLMSGIELHRREHKLQRVLFELLGGSGHFELVHLMHQQLFQIIQLMIADRTNSEESDSAHFEKAYLIQQLILGIWHSQVEKEWMQIDAEAITSRALGMIEACCANEHLERHTNVTVHRGQV